MPLVSIHAKHFISKNLKQIDSKIIEKKEKATMYTGLTYPQSGTFIHKKQ